MAQRLIALEWDRAEARYVVARLSPGKVAVEHAGRVAWSPGAEAAPADAGHQIAAALAERRASKLEALVLVNRLQAEVKPLDLPPAPDHELPDMVRFASLKELSANGDDSPLDFVPRPGSPELDREVLAAALEPETFAQIKHVCSDAGVRPIRMGLRPCSGAALALRRDAAHLPTAVLVIELLPAQFDASLVLEGQTALVRTARIDAAKLALDAASYPKLVAEVRRTLAACGPRLDGKKVEVIHLVGDSPSLERFARHLGDELELPVDVVSPWEASGVSVDLSHVEIADDGRYGALIGALLDEASAVRPAIDFLNPRKPPPPPNTLRPRILAGVAAVCVVALGVWWVQSGLAKLDGELADLKRESTGLDKNVGAAKDLVDRASVVAKWADSEIVWLKELQRLSTDAPDSKELVLTNLGLTSLPSGNGDVKLDGVLRDSAGVGKLITNLRDAGHEVSSQGGQDVRGSKTNEKGPMAQYGWRFQASMTVKPGLDATKPAGPTPGAKTTAVEASTKTPIAPAKTGEASPVEKETTSEATGDPAKPASTSDKPAPAATGQATGK